VLLTPEQIKQAIDELHQRKPGKILHTVEIYEAIAQAQYNEDMKEAMMEIEQKLEILKKLDTKDLIAKLHQYEDELETALREAASFKDLNRGYLSSTGDCQEVKKLLAELRAQTPATNGAGKKLTLADKEDWLQGQRTENEELAAAIAKQKDTAFLLENNEIKADMAHRRLTGATAVLALKTQQIAFFASS